MGSSFNLLSLGGNKMGAKLVVHTDKKTHTVSINKDKTIVGSGRYVDVRIPHPTVASNHFQLNRLNDEWRMRVIGCPPHGISVNGQKIDNCRLAPGDLITVGKVRMTFQFGGGEVTVRETQAVDPDFVALRRAYAQTVLGDEQLVGEGNSKRVGKFQNIAISRGALPDSRKATPLLKKGPDHLVETTQKKYKLFGVLCLMGLVIGVVVVGKKLLTGPLNSRQLNSKSEPSDIQYWSPESAQVPANCGYTRACLLEAERAVKRARELIDRRLVSGENLFVALQISHQGLDALSQAGGAEGELHQELKALHSQIEHLLEKSISDKKYGYQRAMRLRDYARADQMADEFKMLFPNREDYGFILAEQWKKRVEHCKRVKGTKHECL